MKVPPSELTPEHLLPYLKCQGSEKKEEKPQQGREKQKKKQKKQESSSEYLPYLKCQGTAGRRSTGTRSLHIQP